MSDFPPSTEELIETFEDLQEWDERYDFMIDLGRELPALPVELQTEENIVEGCMSTVWLVTELPDGVEQPMAIQADSDSIIVKGLIVILLAFYSRQTSAEIVDSNVGEFLKQLGLDQHLSPQRRNGLFSMIKRLKLLAATYSGASPG
ncbi:SufE family protein [bacterium]|jgi:cysteine desulfuration protein SufE|nr:SufE family protein [bacterium]MDA7913398.1 SufE family protein [bacterium]MDA7923901.1 SufE family protein [Mariniblastus sp.]MDA7925948.1 SufE family protein [Mariniblastus sp.]MDB4483666.1 SufE family protein [bacterium]